MKEGLVQVRVKLGPRAFGSIVIGSHVLLPCVNSTSLRQQISHRNMAELLTRLLSDPLVDNNGERLRDVRGDESVRKLVKYMRSLKAQDVPLQAQGKPLVEVTCPSITIATGD